jgi:hypothetical protein
MWYFYMTAAEGGLGADGNELSVSSQISVSICVIRVICVPIHSPANISLSLIYCLRVSIFMPNSVNLSFA